MNTASNKPSPITVFYRPGSTTTLRLRPQLQLFAEHMEKRLQYQDASAGDFSEMSDDVIKHNLERNLEQALSVKVRGDMICARSWADVANFAFMGYMKHQAPGQILGRGLLPFEFQPDKATAGIYEKFMVARRDGKDHASGPKAKAEYFVLDIVHDPYSWPALKSYAEACAGDLPKLAEGVRKRLEICAKEPADRIEDALRIKMARIAGEMEALADRLTEAGNAEAGSKVKQLGTDLYDACEY